MDCDIGMIGLAVMGQNLVLNLEDHGYRVAVYNRSFGKTREFLDGSAKGKKIDGFEKIEQFISSLKRPRKIILLVKAGGAVDQVVEEIYHLLEKGDIIIDGGNSYYKDTIRRAEFCARQGIFFFGMGVSGGEEGARKGPSLMPGGLKEVWEELSPILESISAKAKEDGAPCVAYMGPGGAGHYVKMVHNGIEYGDIQVITEIYAIMRDALGMNLDDIGAAFKQWNEGVLQSFLVEGAAAIFTTLAEDGKPLLDKIVDKAGQKGTGKWTSQESLDLGYPLTLITDAVFARCLSAMKEDRVRLSALFQNEKKSASKEQNISKELLEELSLAMYAAKIISYTQGFGLLKKASGEYKWNLNLAECARIWRAGCIIRSRFLNEITNAFEEDHDLEFLIESPFFQAEIEKSIPALRKIVLLAIAQGVSIPCLTAALTFFDGVIKANSSANMIQALRDYFGAHTFERVDKPGAVFTYDWHHTGRTTDSASTTYNR